MEWQGFMSKKYVVDSTQKAFPKKKNSLPFFGAQGALWGWLPTYHVCGPKTQGPNMEEEKREKKDNYYVSANDISFEQIQI